MKKAHTRISYSLIPDNHQKHHRFGINKLTRDDNVLFSAGRDSLIRQWDISNPAKTNNDNFLRSYFHHADWVNDIAVCEQGSRLISCSSDKTIKIWNTDDEVCISTYRHHKDYIKCLSHCENTSKFASASLDGEVNLWDSSLLGQNSDPVLTINATKASIYSLATNKEGNILGIGSSSKILSFFDTRTGEKITKLKGHLNNIKCLHLSSDGRHALSGSSDDTVKLWDIRQQRVLTTFDMHYDSVWSLLVNDSFTKFWSGGRDKYVFEVDIQKCSSKFMFQEEYPIITMEFGSDEQSSLWIGTNKSTFRYWDWNGIQENKMESFHASSDLDLSKKDGAILSGTIRKKKLQKVPILKSPLSSIEGAAGIETIKVLDDRLRLLSIDDRQRVQVWSILNGQVLEDLGCVNFDEELAKREMVISTPSWFSHDCKTGIITIHLDSPQCFNTECYETPDSDVKVNYGHLLLKRLFDGWIKKREADKENEENEENKSNNKINNDNGNNDNVDIAADKDKDNEEVRDTDKANIEAIVNDFEFLYPQILFENQKPFNSNTPVILCDDRYGKGSVIMRLVLSDFSTNSGNDLLRIFSPGWLIDCIYKNKVEAPSPTRFLFTLKPHEDEKKLAPLPSGEGQSNRLTAQRMIRISKISRYIIDTLNISPPVVNGTPLPIDEFLEVLLFDNVLAKTIDLGSLKRCYWKSSEEIPLTYRLKKR